MMIMMMVVMMWLELVVFGHSEQAGELGLQVDHFVLLCSCTAMRGGKLLRRFLIAASHFLTRQRVGLLGGSPIGPTAVPHEPLLALRRSHRRLLVQLVQGSYIISAMFGLIMVIFGR